MQYNVFIPGTKTVNEFMLRREEKFIATRFPWTAMPLNFTNQNKLLLLHANKADGLVFHYPKSNAVHFLYRKKCTQKCVCGLSNGGGPERR